MSSRRAAARRPALPGTTRIWSASIGAPTANRSSMRQIAQVATRSGASGIDGGDPQLVVGGAAKLKHPSVARSSGRVTYESWSYEINLWEAPIVDRLDLESDLTPTLRPAVRTSDQWNHSPDLSPDERQLAFISTRSGAAEVWSQRSRRIECAPIDDLRPSVDARAPFGRPTDRIDPDQRHRERPARSLHHRCASTAR